jgi:penicillin amidase
VAVHANDRRPGVAALGADFAPAHRARRIRELVAAGTPAAAVHIDARAVVLRDVLAGLEVNGAARQLRDRLIGCDGVMSASSVDAGAYAAWRGAFVRGLHDHPVLRPLRAASAYDELFAPWTDPLGRIGVALESMVAGLGAVACGPAAAAALAEAAALPPKAWGERHRLAPIQALPGGAPTAELSGDTDCVLATSSVPGVSDACWRGPVARYVWDLGDRAASRWIVPFGASGRPGDPHYAINCRCGPPENLFQCRSDIGYSRSPLSGGRRCSLSTTVCARSSRSGRRWWSAAPRSPSSRTC